MVSEAFVKRKSAGKKRWRAKLRGSGGMGTHTSVVTIFQEGMKEADALEELQERIHVKIFEEADALEELDPEDIHLCDEAIAPLYVAAYKELGLDFNVSSPIGDNTIK